MGPEALEDMISAFARLPGIGRKTAQRLVFHLIKMPPREAETLATAIVNGRSGIQYCEKCYNFTDKGETACAICRDETRDPGIICVVEEASHVLVQDPRLTLPQRARIGGDLGSEVEQLVLYAQQHRAETPQ